MLAEHALGDLLNKSDLSKKDRFLLCLAVEVDTPKQVKEIRAIAVRAGFRSAARDRNISSHLSRSKGLAVRAPEGWLLTSAGRDHVQELASGFVKTPKIRVATALHSHLALIQDPQVARFVEEAIGCFERDLYRAAVVLAWVGAVSILHDYVVNNKLQAFNTEARRRDKRWRDAKTRDDLARMKEGHFLDILEAISVLGHSRKLELKNCLDLRNGCGHPNSLRISENRAAAHIEVLMLNVFSCFKV